MNDTKKIQNSTTEIHSKREVSDLTLEEIKQATLQAKQKLNTIKRQQNEAEVIFQLELFNQTNPESRKSIN